MTWFDHITRTWIHVKKSQMSLRRMDANNKQLCKNNPVEIIPNPAPTTERIPVKTPKIVPSDTSPQSINLERSGIIDAENKISQGTERSTHGNTNTFGSSGSIHDPLKKNIYFLNKISPKHRPHSKQKMSEQRDTKEYPDTAYEYDNDDDLGFYYDDI